MHFLWQKVLGVDKTATFPIMIWIQFAWTIRLGEEYDIERVLTISMGDIKLLRHTFDSLIQRCIKGRWVSTSIHDLVACFRTGSWYSFHNWKTNEHPFLTHLPTFWAETFASFFFWKLGFVTILFFKNPNFFQKIGSFLWVENWNFYRLTDWRQTQKN